MDVPEGSPVCCEHRGFQAVMVAKEEDSAYRIFEVLIQVYTDEFCTLDPTPEKMSPKKHTFRDPRLVGKVLTSRRPALSRQD